MQVLSTWRFLVILDAPIAQSMRTAATANHSTICWASFHSTDTCFEKWKHDSDVGSNQQPSKESIGETILVKILMNTLREYLRLLGKDVLSGPSKPGRWDLIGRETLAWSKSTYQKHGAKSRIESDNEAFIVCGYADRRILGLPTAGPLKIEDVKSAVSFEVAS